MDELFNLEGLTLREVRAIRQGLNTIQISGIDAMFIGTLQVKIDSQVKEIEKHIEKNQTPPLEELELGES
jgi:hypothetical protein|tara:strand:- start:3180 stop:3389 length:210 start_codon:yes stop_codon:yes gene_type:complete